MKATDLFIWGFVAHLFADWFLQNEWQALNKTDLKHPAAWVHSGIHFVAAWLVFPLWAVFFLSLSHLLIDTRVPLQWWRRTIRQTTEGAIMVPFALWQDQAAHIVCLGAAAALVARFGG